MSQEAPLTDDPAAPPPVKRQTIIRNQRGLHARAAVKFAKLVDEYDADIRVVKENMAACGRSIMGLMMLAAGPGTKLELQARGKDAEQAIEAVAALIERKFDEE